MKQALKSAGKLLAKTAALKMGKSIIKRGGVTTIAMGAALVAGYYIYQTLNK